MNTDKQSDRFQLTINNPQDYGMGHQKIKETLVFNFKTLIYFCMADEKGSCFHTHVFVCFSSRVRFSMIKKYFPTAHIESCKGTSTENICYIKKSGKWKDDIKHGTQVDNTYEEYGTPPPDSKGKREDLTDLYNMVMDGLTNAEIIARNQDFILYLDKLDKLRTTILTEKYKGIRRTNLEVTYVSGITGSGKTRGILDEYGDSNVYRVTDYAHPFDGYNCQSVIVFDEFRDSLELKDMLNYLDIYPIELPARFANKYACYEKVFIVSNWDFNMQYEKKQTNDTESYKAFIRRIGKIIVYEKDRKVIYDSVKDYMNREENWKNLTEKEKEFVDSLFKNVQCK